MPNTPLSQRLPHYAELLANLKLDPAAITSNAQLDAILAEVEAEAEHAVRRLKPHSPEAEIMAALDGFCETGDEEAAQRRLEAATRRGKLRGV